VFMSVYVWFLLPLFLYVIVSYISFTAFALLFGRPVVYYILLHCIFSLFCAHQFVGHVRLLCVEKDKIKITKNGRASCLCVKICAATIGSFGICILVR